MNLSTSEQLTHHDQNQRTQTSLNKAGNRAGMDPSGNKDWTRGVAFIPKARHSGIFFLTEPSSFYIEAVILLAPQTVSVTQFLFLKA